MTKKRRDKDLNIKKTKRAFKVNIIEANNFLEGESPTLIAI